MGPEPATVQRQELLNQWIRVYSIGTFELLRGASEDYLAAGQIDISRNEDICYAISDWYSLDDELEKQYGLLRAAHANIGEYLTDSIPGRILAVFAHRR